MIDFYKRGALNDLNNKNLNGTKSSNHAYKQSFTFFIINQEKTSET